MESVYCPYSGEHWPLAETSEEHIFPLSLGGSNDFTIRVHKGQNSRLNREIDAPLAASVFSAVSRNKADARWHSGKPVRAPSVFARSGSGERLELFFREYGYLGLKSARSKQEVTLEKLQIEGLRLEFSEGHSLRLRFAAKVVLGAGPKLFGQPFEKTLLQHELRSIANADTSEAFAMLSQSTLKGWGWPHLPLESDMLTNALLEAISKDSNETALVVSRFSPGHFLFAVSILGELSACLLCPNEFLEFVDTHLVDLGVVYTFPDRKLKVRTLRKALTELNAHLGSPSAA